MSGRSFEALDVAHAPGQSSVEGLGDDLVDFSHGDVDAFQPFPGAIAAVENAHRLGAAMAYSEYRGHSSIRAPLAERLSAFTGSPVDAERGLILTPGTQTALFLSLSSLVEPGDRVAIIEPDYFANRKIVSYLRGDILSVRLYHPERGAAGLDLDELSAALAAGARVVCLSNPNNPTGVVYSREDLESVVERVCAAGAFLVVDQLYSRLVYDGVPYTHVCALPGAAESTITLLGPSKTESLSGFRVGCAVGPAWLIDRMEQLLSIVSLRAAGYNQAALDAWLTEPAGWIEERTAAHRVIRDELVATLRRVPGLSVRLTEGGSYLFATLPRLDVSVDELVDRARTQARVVVTRGAEFGPGAASGVRFNFSQDRIRAAAAVERFATLVTGHLA